MQEWRVRIANGSSMLHSRLVHVPIMNKAMHIKGEKCHQPGPILPGAN